MFKSLFAAALFVALLSNACAFKMCFGCPKVVSIESSDVQDAVNYAVGHLKGQSIQHARIIGATVQAMNGINYHLTFETQCDDKLDVFKAVVYRNATTTSDTDMFAMISMDTLISRRSAVACAGCVHDVSVRDAEVLKAGSFAWSELEALEEDVDMRIGKNFMIHVAGVQSVNGLNYHLLLQAEFDNMQVQHTAIVYKDLNNQHFLTRSSFVKALL
eukprot:TRINITY_DN1344_c0_g1_i1.p1 TRINITY_DN1344_c0_g1~~TRINITY_DN1344_c0_g1_i1.p1  ORF type:complete len:216 (-),score=61.61 TRINITY_DN1344_c0_g1_i1:42-689(-)